MSFQQSHAQPNAPGRIEQDTRPVPELLARPPIMIERPLFPEQAPACTEKGVFMLSAVQIFGKATVLTDAFILLWAPHFTVLSKQENSTESEHYL